MFTAYLLMGVMWFLVVISTLTVFDKGAIKRNKKHK